MSFAEAELTNDGFLGGRLNILQPKKGYRAGIEPVLLAASVAAVAGERVLDLGLGVGVAALCLGARVPGLELVGVELQPAYADLARRNAAANGIALAVVEGDVRRLPAAVRTGFDRVLMNPPFFAARDRIAAADSGREVSRGESAALAEWMAAGLRRVRSGGTLTIVQPAARLPAVLAAMPRAGAVAQPVAPRPGHAASLVLVTATKGSRAGFRLLPLLVLHGPEGSGYAPWASEVLRNGAALPAEGRGNGPSL